MKKFFVEIEKPFLFVKASCPVLKVDTGDTVITLCTDKCKIAELLDVSPRVLSSMSAGSKIDLQI